MNSKNLILFASSIFLAALTHPLPSQAQVGNTIQTAMQNAAAQRATQTSTGASRGTSNPYATASGNDAASAASNTASTQMMGALANVAAGGTFAYICSSCSVGGGCWACPMIPIAMQAASVLGRDSGRSSGANYDLTSRDWNMGQYPNGSNGLGGDPYGDGGGAGGAGTLGTQGAGTPAAQLAAGLAKLKSDMAKAGVTISPDGKTMTTANGRKFDLSKGGSDPQSMAAMGLTPSEIGEAMTVSEKLAKQQAAKFAQMKQLPDAGAGGGGGGRSAASVPNDGAGGGFQWGEMRNRNARPKANLSGLTKKLGDDTIGVSGDDIFEMVTRRYQARDKENNFLKDQ